MTEECINLNAKENDGDKSNPAVQSVEIGARCRRQIVTVKDCFQADSRDDECKSLQYGMCYLQRHLPLVAEHSIYQHCCDRHTLTTPSLSNTHIYRVEQHTVGGNHDGRIRIQTLCNLVGVGTRVKYERLAEARLWDLVEQGLTSHQTHHRSYRGQVLQVI